MRSRFALVLLLAVTAGVRAADIDPSVDGPFAVGSTTVVLTDTSRGRTLTTEVWYPADTAGRDVAVHPGRYRLVLVAHGNCGFRTNYEYLTVPLAGWGFVVAAPDFPGFNKADCDAHVPAGDIIGDPPLDLRFLATALRDRNGPAATLAVVLRRRRTGLVGHSLGGLAVVNASLADRDFRAVVALAPLATAMNGTEFVGLKPSRAALVAAGTAGTTLPPASFAEPFFGALPTPAFLVEIVGGTLSGFTDMVAHLSPEALARQEALTRRYATAFLRRYLAGDRRLAAVLTPEDAAAEGPDVELTARPR